LCCEFIGFRYTKYRNLKQLDLHRFDDFRCITLMEETLSDNSKAYCVSINDIIIDFTSFDKALYTFEILMDYGL